jgi:S-adenosylmethionine hydrolase
MEEKRDGGLIALITDFGNKDYFIGVMKGVIKQINPGAETIDIANDIPSYNLLPASFVVEQTHRFFPPAAIFLVVVDPGVGTHRKILLVEHDGRFFIGPDNGVLTPILTKEEKTVFMLDNEKYFLIRGHSTFEARDKMAPAAAYLTRGVDPGEMATRLSPHLHDRAYVLNPDYFPTLSENNIQARIVYIDKFGNVVTNIKADFLFNTLEASGFFQFKTVLNGKEIKVFHDTYEQAGTGIEPFMLIGSHQNLEIALNRQSAASILNVEIGQKIFIEFY